MHLAETGHSTNSISIEAGRGCLRSGVLTNKIIGIGDFLKITSMWCCFMIKLFHSIQLVFSCNELKRLLFSGLTNHPTSTHQLTHHPTHPHSFNSRYQNDLVPGLGQLLQLSPAVLSMNSFTLNYLYDILRAGPWDRGTCHRPVS